MYNKEVFARYAMALHFAWALLRFLMGKDSMTYWSLSVYTEGLYFVCDGPLIFYCGQEASHFYKTLSEAISANCVSES